MVEVVKPSPSADKAAGPSATPTQAAPARDHFPVYDSVARYEKIKRIGEGTYGVVYKARDRETGEIVALKKVRMERERDGFPLTSLREIRVLQTCRHPNLVALQKIVTGSTLDSVFLVFEYCAHDLGRLLDSMARRFQEAEVKCLLRQLLAAVDHLHARWVQHRDLKLSNLLLTSNGRLKLCDFGLARYFHAWEQEFTPRVVTLWYRAPEILLGLKTYTEAVDMWAVGCIMGELLRHEPLFPAKGELEILGMHSRLLGAPTERIWKGFSKLPKLELIQLPAQPYNYVEREFPQLAPAGVDLLNALLTYDPARRITAREALRHPYFSTPPLPIRPEDMPTFPSAHDARASGWHQRRVEADEVEAERGAARGRGDPQGDAHQRMGEAFSTDDPWHAMEQQAKKRRQQ